MGRERGKRGRLDDPATIPAVVRTSVNPNNPTRTDSRYPPKLAMANPAPAAAPTRLPETSTAVASTKAAMILQREQPADRGDRPVPGQVQVEVNRRSHGQQPGADHHPQAEPL
jgi:hypothetical protein